MAKTIVLVTQGKQQYMKVLTSTAYRRGYSPYVDEDGFWVAYDDAQQQYVTTDVLARGEKGDQGDKGENGADYILSEFDRQEIAQIIDEHTYDVEKVTLQMTATVSDDILYLNFGTSDSPAIGSVEVATDVTVNTEGGE